MIAFCPICRATFDPLEGGHDVDRHLREHGHGELARALRHVAHDLVAARHRIDELDAQILVAVATANAAAEIDAALTSDDDEGREHVEVLTQQEVEDALRRVGVAGATAAELAASLFAEQVRAHLKRLHASGRIGRDRRNRADGHGSEFAYRVRVRPPRVRVEDEAA